MELELVAEQLVLELVVVEVAGVVAELLEDLLALVDLADLVDLVVQGVRLGVTLQGILAYTELTSEEVSQEEVLLGNSYHKVVDIRVAYI